MAFKLDKGERERRKSLVTELRDLSGKLEDAIREYNAAVEKLQEPLQVVINTYNEKVNEAAGFAEYVASRADDEYDEKSERWQEGEKGEAASEWKGAWSDADLETIEMDFPEPLDESVEEANHADTLENLPDQSDA